MGKLRRFGEAFFVPLAVPTRPDLRASILNPQYQEVARVKAHHGNPIAPKPHYYTVKFGHVHDPNKFDTFAAAEAYINLIHSLKE